MLELANFILQWIVLTALLLDGYTAFSPASKEREELSFHLLLGLLQEATLGLQQLARLDGLEKERKLKICFTMQLQQAQRDRVELALKKNLQTWEYL